MKVKQVPGPSRSESPGQSPSQFDESPQQTRPLSSTSNNSSGTYIWTRSAAVRAAQQHKQAHDIAQSCHPGKHRPHQHHQHVLGKIVKPIPVRPMSSSSSSSSNHSSSLSNSIHLRTGESNATSSNSGGFSLIAKYFASFPATRLAKTSTQIDAVATPFLPFKKAPSESKPEQIQSTFVLRSHQASTDHLCTNFRRMIKLNDHELPASPLRTAQTSPFTSGNTPTSFEPLNYCLDSKDEQLDTVEERNQPDSHETSRFGQITMETRSTRRFLIKHHPYLKLNSIDSQVRSMGRNKSASDTQRPSINLMKKLSSRKPVAVEAVGHVPLDLNRSGRSSRSNNSGLNEQPLSTDYNSLVKFIDTAPLPAKAAKSHQTSTSKRRQSRTLTTAAALSTEINSMSKTKQKTTDDDLLDCCDYCCLNANESECLDEQEEDSSGYYSSYHSADLVSSSGGSCGGGGGYNTCSNNNTAKEAAVSVNLELNKANVPQHHYHTRYLSQFLNQDMHENAATKNLIPATPTTRLRSGRKSGMDNYNLGCELDLDQIEND